MGGIVSQVVYDTDGLPRITLTIEPGYFQAVLEVEGLDPQRSTTEEERRVGIQSLNPPTVRVRAQTVRSKSHRALIDASCRAVASSAASTLGDNGGPGGLLLTYYRVARGLREALRQLGEDI